MKSNDSPLTMTKQILSSQAYADTSLLNKLNDSNDLYLHRLQELNKFKSRSKQTMKSDTLLLEWLNEQSNLSLNQSKIEKELQQVIESLFSSNPSDSNIQDIIYDLSTYQESHSQQHKDMLTQLKELKDLLNQTIKNHHHSSQVNTKFSSKHVDESNEFQEKNQSNVINSIYADMLIQIRLSHYNITDELKHDEKLILDELLIDQKSLIQLFRKDYITRQDQQVDIDFQLLPDDDVSLTFLISYRRKLVLFVL